MRRDVKIDHDEFFAVDGSLDDDGFGAVVEWRCDFRERDGVMDEG